MRSFQEATTSCAVTSDPSLNRASGFSRSLGGKGINVSRVVQELGEPTIAFGVAGGEDSHILRQLTGALTMRHAFVAISGSARNNIYIKPPLHVHIDRVV